MSVPFISIANLGVRFLPSSDQSPDSLVAIKGLSLGIDKGEIVSVLGPSGCGKTTFLKVISSLLFWEAKRVELEGGIRIGENILLDDKGIIQQENKHEIKQRIGFVFQSPALLEWRTVVENIRLSGEILRDRSVIERSEEYSDLVGLGRFNKAYPRELSGGMRARLALARELVRQPEVLLMDESFSSLDEITRDEMHEELIRIWLALHTTIIFVTHSIPEAVFLSNRVAVMTRAPGRIFQEFYIGLDYPRKKDLKEGKEFISKAKNIRECLEEAVRV